MRLLTSIKWKILLGVFFVVAFSLLASGLFIYFHFAAILRQQAIHDDELKLQQTVNQLNGYIDDIQKYASNIVLDPIIQQFVQQETYPSDIDRLKAVNEVMKRLKEYNILRDYIKSSALVLADGSVYWTLDSDDDYFKQRMNQSWYQNMRGVQAGFTIPHQLPYQADIQESDFISYVMKFKAISRSQEERENVLILNIDESVFSAVLQANSAEYDGILWKNRDGYIYLNRGMEPQWVRMADAGRDAAGAEAATAVSRVRGGNLLTNRSSHNGWEIAVYVSSARFYQQVKDLLYYLLLFIACGIVLSLILFTPVISSIVKPIVQLSKGMRRVSMGDLDTNVRIRSRDEIGILGNGFALMQHNLKRLLAERSEQERRQRQMAAELLLAQINPHFIYNTLNSVIFLARRKKTEQIERMVESFIGIMQNAMRIGEGGLFATVEQEAEVVNHYCRIQQYRYPDGFEVVWSIDPALASCLVPKSLLQPLVENALFHGLSPKEEQGTIRIAIARSGEQKIGICVQDDGLGMDAARISAALADPADAPGRPPLRNIGLRNIKERLAFLYGPEAKMEIASEVGRGTQISLTLPRQSAATDDSR